jgi:hypothetical protein
LLAVIAGIAIVAVAVTGGKSILRVSQAKGPDSKGRPSIAEAKEALLALLRSNMPPNLRLDTEVLSRQAETPDGTSGAFSWGPLFIELSAKTYAYWITYSSRSRPCTWHYQGDFEFRQGHWVALAPRVLSYALGR